MRAFAAITALVAAALLRAAPAHACEPCPSCLRSSNVHTNVVPANTVIRVRYTFQEPRVSSREWVQLVDARGRKVPGTWVDEESGWLAFVPTQPLKAGRTYALSDRFPTVGGQMSCRAGAAFRPWRTFRTGPAVPQAAPPAGAWPTEARCVRKTCESSACCGPYDGWQVEFGGGIPPGFVRAVGTVAAEGFGPYRFETGEGFRLFPSMSCNGAHPVERAPSDFTVTLQAHDDRGGTAQATHALKVHHDGQSCVVERVPVAP